MAVFEYCEGTLKAYCLVDSCPETFGFSSKEGFSFLAFYIQMKLAALESPLIP